MTAYRRVNDSRHMLADCQEPGSAPEPYARQSSVGCLYLYLYSRTTNKVRDIKVQLAKASTTSKTFSRNVCVLESGTRRSQTDARR